MLLLGFFIISLYRLCICVLDVNQTSKTIFQHSHILHHNFNGFQTRGLHPQDNTFQEYELENMDKDTDQEPFKCPSQCSCFKAKLKVECNQLNLTKLPDDIPRATKQLWLKQNMFVSLPNNMFSNLPNLEFLSINGNRITKIGKDTISYLRNLKVLDIGRNPLSVSVLQKYILCKLSATATMELLLTKMYSYTFHKLNNDSFHCLNNTGVKIIDMSWNNNICGYLPDDLFSGLPRLEQIYFSFSQCKTINMLAFSNTPNVKQLGLKYNKLKSMPSFIDQRSGKPVLRNLQYLDVANNELADLHWDNMPGLESLRTLRLANNGLYSLRPHILKNLTRLSKLDITTNKIKYIEESALTSNSLNTLYLSRNPLKLDFSDVNIFRKAPSLETLLLSGISYDSPKVLELIFQNLTSLKSLQISSSVENPITFIPKNTFRGLRNLRNLRLMNNQIQHVVAEIFLELDSLQTLFLNNNRIKLINSTSFPENLIRRLRALNLSHNPWECTCDLLWFKQWIENTSVKIVSLHAPHGYICDTPIKQQGVSLLDLRINEDLCLSYPVSYGLVLSFFLSMCFSLCTIFLSCAYRFRWQLRTTYFYFEIWLHTSAYCLGADVETIYEFDVFVSYDQQDLNWVKMVLVPELEEKSMPPFKLYLQERNWPVGEDIIACISDSVEKCRKTLLIVTNSYTQNPWCQEQLAFAQLHQLEQDKDNIILAVMEDIEPINLTPRLLLEMKRRTIIEWTEDELGQGLFWKKLKNAIHKPESSVRHVIPSQEFIDGSYQQSERDDD